MKTRSHTMKRTWKYLSGLMCLVLAVMLNPAPASAANPIIIAVNGSVLECDTPPFVENGTTMVPLRSIFEALGATVKWDGATGTITAERSSDAIITMQIGNRTGSIGDIVPPWQSATMTLGVSPKIVNGSTFVPARFVSEAFGADVTWDGAARNVIIKSKGLGKSYYVASNGNDSNPGTIDKPWRTFEKVFYSVEPGNTVYVRGGTYKERLWIHRSGALGAPITYMAYPGEAVTIDGEGVEIPDNWGGLIEVGAYTSFIRVSGFWVINSADKGIFVHEGNNIIIDGNSMDYTNSSGIAAVNIRNLIVDKNKITRANLKGGGTWEAIRVGDCQTVQVSNNYIADSSMEGLDIVESSNVKVFSNEVTGLPSVGIYVCGWDKLTQDIEVYDNVIHDNKAGICVNSENGGTVEDIKIYQNRVYNNADQGFAIGWGGFPDTPVPVHDVEFFDNVSYNNGVEGLVIFGREKSDVRNISIRNNLIYGNKGAGVNINGIAASPFTIKDISLINNTIHGNGSEDVWASGGIFISNHEKSEGNIENITVRNNIVSGNHHFSMAVWPWGKTPTGLTIDHNLIDGYTDDKEGYGETYGENAVKGGQSFMDVSKDNFHLSPGSAAIDSGSSDGAPTEDFDGTLRPQGSGIDIGAFEFKP